MNVKLTFTHHMADIIEANRFAREQRIKSWLIISFGGGNMMVGMAMLLQGLPKGFEIVCTGTVVFLIGLLATRMAGMGAWFLKATSVPYNLLIDDSGITFLDAQPVFVSWQVLLRWFETTNLIAIVQTGTECLAIPKRSMSTDQLETLRQLLRRELGDDARW